MQQLGLDLPVRPALGREDFLVTSSNQAAVALLDTWPDWPAPMAVIAGPAGSGKTHLSEVWRQRCDAVGIRLDELSIDSVPQILRHRAVIIENLPAENLPEKPLFHLFNLCRQEGAHVLLTSTILPVRWRVDLPDLRSRLRLLPAAELGAPDDALMRALLIKQFDDRQIPIEETVIEYLVNRIERSAASAARVATAIDKAALAAKARVTRNFVARLLPELAGLEGDGE